MHQTWWINVCKSIFKCKILKLNHCITDVKCCFRNACTCKCRCIISHFELLCYYQAYFPLIRHWIAVFGQIYQRSLVTVVDRLCARFKPVTRKWTWKLLILVLMDTSQWAKQIHFVILISQYLLKLFDYIPTLIHKTIIPFALIIL